MGPVWTGLNSFTNFFRLRDVIRLQSSKFKIHLRIEMLWNYHWKLFILKGSHQRRRTFENMICKGTVHRNKWIISEQRGRARGRCGGSFGDVVDHSLQLPHLWPCFICMQKAYFFSPPCVRIRQMGRDRENKEDKGRERGRQSPFFSYKNFIHKRADSPDSKVLQKIKSKSRKDTLQ